MDGSIAELNQKLDLLAAQVAYLTEQARENEQARRDRAELVHDLTPVVNDAYRLTVEQLEEVQEYADLGELLRLLKRLLRNARNFDGMLDQLESGMDLLQTVGPISDAGFDKLVDILTEAERKGYFTFARGGMRIADKVVTSFGEEDMRRLDESVEPLLSTVKELARPEVLMLAQRTLAAVEQEVQKPLNASYAALFSELRNPDVRRGLALTLRLLRVIGEQAAPGGNGANKSALQTAAALQK